MVWHHTVYAAKWWTKGDVPDNPVLNAWETPWQLVGPVLPGETPIPQPTLPPSPTRPGRVRRIYKRVSVCSSTAPRSRRSGGPRATAPRPPAPIPDSSPWAALTQDEIDKILGGHATTG